MLYISPLLSQVSLQNKNHHPQRILQVLQYNSNTIPIQTSILQQHNSKTILPIQSSHKKTNKDTMTSQTATVEQLITKNSEYVKSYTAPHNVEHFMSGKGKFPSTLIVSCCDPRLIPEEFGQFSREEFITVRNAGGRAGPALRDITILTCMAEITDLVVIHHTDCGMTHLTNDDIRTTMKSRGLGDDKLDSIDFGEILDLKQSVRDDVTFLKESPYIRKGMNVHGYVFDLLDSGRLIKVE